MPISYLSYSAILIGGARRDDGDRAGTRRARAAGAIPDRIVFQFPKEGRVNNAMRRLHMAVKHDPLRDTARMALEPWVIVVALVRLGDRKLSREEQAVVVKAARGRNKIKWPVWWEVFEQDHAR